jgi:hypothetical protein
MNPQYFRLANGEVIKHYSELPEAIDRLGNSQFSSHVNEHKNDFASWVTDVYGLSDLSYHLRNANSKQETKRVMNAYLRMAEVKFQFKKPMTNQAQEIQKKIEIKNEITDADRYFKENPLIVSQRVEAKKDNLVLEKITLPMLTGYETAEQLISIFKDSYAKSYERVVFLRKNGYDTKLIEVMLFRILPKIKIFEASKDHKDSDLIKRYLNEVIEEINGMK